MSHPRSTAELTPLDPSRLSAWAQIGTSVSGTGSAREALHVAGLANWNIRKVPMQGTDITADGVTTIDNPSQVMLVYTDPDTRASRYLSTVGKNYGVHQNEAGAALIDALVAEAGATAPSFAGSLDGGRQTFVTIALPDTVYVDGVDLMQLHLVVFNSHDGSSAFRVMIVPFRIVCANQLSLSIRHHVSSVSIRHTSRSQINVEEIRSKLGLLYKYGHAFEAEAQRLIRTEMTNAEFQDLIREVWPLKDGATSRTLSNDRRRRGELTRLWTSAPTQEPIFGTRWAGLQAVTEYLDHSAPAGSELVRAHRVMGSDDVAKHKQSAYDLLSN